MPGTASYGLVALEITVNGQLPDGAKGQGVSLMRDHGSRFDAIAVMKVGSILGIAQPFLSDNHPQDYTDTEYMTRTL
jgi:hypothetical protein